MATKILVIEDNQANLDLMIYLLGAYGYEWLAVTNGEDGLTIAKREIPHLVICDIELPGIDGYTVLAKLKEDMALRQVPVLAVTAYAMVGDRKKILSAGFDAYLPKPISPEEFISTIENLLQPNLRSTVAPFLHTEYSETAVPEPRGVTILMVDNSRANLEIVKNTLEPFGYKVICVSNLEEAIHYLQEKIPDLILTDLHMPKSSGYDFMQFLREDKDLRNIPVVVLTSSMFSSQDRMECLRRGASSFIVRPLEPQALLSEIESVLAAHTRQSRS